MKRGIRLLAFFLVTLTLALNVVFVRLSYLQAQMIVHPAHVASSRTPADIGRGDYQDVLLTTPDGLRLHGFYAPPTGMDGATMLFVHGHGGNRSGLLHAAEMFVEPGYGMFFVELRNHGISDGNVTTMGLLEVIDVQAAFAFLVQQPEVNPNRIAIFGSSMGGATAIRAFPAIPEARVLVADAPYSSLSDLLHDRIPQDMGIPPLLYPQLIIAFANNLSAANLYDANPLDDIQHLNGRPVFFSHGTADPIVPFINGQRLFDAAGEPKHFYIAEGVGHGGAMTTPQFRVELHAFLDQYLNNP